jgi:hypothetical protein
MKVIAEETWSWFLFEDDGQLYLEVLVEHGAVSYEITNLLSHVQAANFSREGHGYITGLASEMCSRALTRQWTAPTLPPNWNELSLAAVREWRKRK